MITPIQALELIEAISVENENDDIYYKISHCFGKCENPHNDWKEEVDLLYNKIVLGIE